ncbi:RagB/SusD family nutrient uptake outer membrane protein [Paraflavisolibacter sp. H34]|uniref:RagB/SusD family nutrient uptake outer membrane protein n=1 Tax=Huijunlia imazamoxiresistens TaxID=3127457 RepID=UPI003017AB5B
MKRIILGLCLAGLLAGSASCSKWMDLKPQDGIVGDEYWQTKEQVESAVIGIYSSIQVGNLPEYFFIWGEARADMVAPGFRASQDEHDIVNLNMLPTNSFANWRGVYQTINYCNTLLQKAPGVLEKDNTFSQGLLDRSVGEALAIRALMYFYLLRTFGEVPLKLDATLSDQDIVFPPKASRDQVLDQVVADLKKAEGAVPATYGNRDEDKGRITRAAVNSLLADVYLWRDRYGEAAAECDKVITSGRFGLVSAANYFNRVFLEGNSAEGIFELQYDAQMLNPFYGLHSPAQKRWEAAGHLAESVYGIDLVNTVPLADVRGDKASFRSTDNTIWKYVGGDNAGTNLRPLEENDAHWIFYRYADVLLMKAEALNEQGQPLEASRIVKTIRQRAGALELKPMDSTSQAAMADFILEERQREFAFEGKRWFDALRNAKRGNYARLHLLTAMASVSVPSERLQPALNKLRDTASHYFPIYVYELQTNKQLVQNPFYK